jgi:exodeoxyribonuclease VII large subunit
MPLFDMPSELFSVSEINLLIKDVISAGIPRAVWVCGEVQNYRRGKHCYFELVEKDEGTKGVKAKINVAIWAGVYPKIDAILKKAENAFELKDGIEIKLLGRIDYYAVGGSISLIVESIDPIYTLGKLAQDRQKLVAELTKAGILEKNKALSIPLVPLNVGLITAFDSAAYKDFTEELRTSGYAFTVHLARALMQGKTCEGSVCAALEALNALDGIDVIVITRGGGSIAELSCFDSKEIAVAVARSRYPVLTGIGHEINTSITDLAAFAFVKTPTAAAQFLTQRVQGFIDGLADSYQRLLQAVDVQTTSGRDRLKEQAFTLRSLTGELLKGRGEEVARLSERLTRSPIELVYKKRSTLKPMARQLQMLSLQGLELRLQKLAHDQVSLKKTIHLRFESSRTKISSVQKIMEFASPRKILQRGFSITRAKNGKLLRLLSDVAVNDEITTELAAGRLLSRVNAVSKEEENA